MAPDGPPRRPGPGGGRERRVPRRRGRRPHRLSDDPPGRQDRVGARPGVRVQGHRRAGRLGARAPVRRHRAQGSRSPRDGDGVPRRTHRSREPRALRGDPRAGGGASQTHGGAGRRPVLRPRQLQVGERLARAPRRGHPAHRHRGAAPRLHPRHGSRRTPGRRRVPDPPRRSHRGSGRTPRSAR